MHTAVNPLAGEEHLKEVIQQLQLMGEVSDDDDDDGNDGDDDDDNAGEEHLKEVIQQLRLTLYNFPLHDFSNHHRHQVVYLKCDAGDDIIILDPKWLCGTLCGLVLSPEFRQHPNISRITLCILLHINITTMAIMTIFQAGFLQQLRPVNNRPVPTGLTWPTCPGRPCCASGFGPLHPL